MHKNWKYIERGIVRGTDIAQEEEERLRAVKERLQIQGVTIEATNVTRTVIVAPLWLYNTLHIV
jgi:hypothetical protein